MSLEATPSRNVLLNVLNNLRTMEPISSLINCREGSLWIAMAVVLQAGQILLISEVTHSIGAFEASFVRSSFLLCTLLFISWRNSETYGFIELVNYILTGLGDSLYIVLAALASNYIWVGDCSAIVLNQPIPSAILACIILGEAMDKTDSVLVFLNACGLVLVSKPSFLFPQSDDIAEPPPTTQPFVGILLASGSLASTVTATLSTRSLAYRNTEDPFLIGTMAALHGIVLSCLGLVITSSSFTLPHNASEWLVTLLLGICGTGALCCYAKSLESEEVLTVTVFMTLGIPLNHMFDLIFLDREIDWWKLGGIVLIIASTFAMYIKSKLR